jgi:hypothetical protein
MQEEQYQLQSSSLHFRTRYERRMNMVPYYDRKHKQCPTEETHQVIPTLKRVSTMVCWLLRQSSNAQMILDAL